MRRHRVLDNCLGAPWLSDQDVQAQRAECANTTSISTQLAEQRRTRILEPDSGMR